MILMNIHNNQKAHFYLHFHIGTLLNFYQHSHYFIPNSLLKKQQFAHMPISVDVRLFFLLWSSQYE